MNQVLEAIRTRRSVRAYKDAPIPQDQLDAVLTAGLYAPSAMNTQNRQFTVVRGEEKLTRLQQAVAQAIGAPDYHRFYGAPVLVILSAPESYPERGADCAVALENLFLAAHSLGIGSVWINQLVGVCDHPQLRETLTSFGVPADHRVMGCAALGYGANQGKTDRENKSKVVYA